MRAHYRDTILDRAGNALAGARVTVRQVGTVNAIVETIYADDTGGATLVQPLTADASGVVSFYLAAPKRADLYVTAPGYTALTVPDIDVTTPVPIAGSTSANQSATLVVAASNASLESIANADYVCDGTADETEINLAIVALPASGGKIVLSEGTFSIAASIVTNGKANVWLQGQGIEATSIVATAFAPAGGWGAIYAADAYFHLSDLTYDGTLQTNSSAVRIQASYGIVERCRFTGTVDVAANCAWLYHRITNNIFDTCDYGVMLDSAAADNQSLIQGNYFVAVSHDVIWVKGRFIRIIGNTIKDCGGGAINVQAAAGKNSSDIVIEGNIVEGQTADTPMIHLQSQDRITVRGNILRDGRDNAIDTGGPEAFGMPEDFVIEGNIISKIGITVAGSESRGILFAGKNHVIANNTIEQCYRAGIIGQGSNCIIANNIVRDCGSGGGEPRGIQLDTAATYNIVTGNRCYDDGSGDQDYGLFLRDAGTTLNFIHGNDFSGNIVAPIGVQNAPVLNTVYDNRPAIVDPGNAGAIEVIQSGTVALVTAGAGETRTLAIPTFIGQTLDLYFKTDGGGDCVITAASDVTNSAGENVMTFSDAGERILLRAIEKGAALAWRVVCNDGVVLS